VAPKRAHTRANPEGPLTTSVSDPEKIISKGKALQRQASGSASAIDSGIPIDTHPFISEKSLVESPAEIQNSQEIKSSSQVSKVEEPSFSSNITDSVLEIDISSRPKELILNPPNRKNIPLHLLLIHHLSNLRKVFYTLTQIYLSLKKFSMICPLRVKKI
jgi:hypothetical protein